MAVGQNESAPHKRAAPAPWKSSIGGFPSFEPMYTFSIGWPPIDEMKSAGEEKGGGFGGCPGRGMLKLGERRRASDG